MKKHCQQFIPIALSLVIVSCSNTSTDSLNTQNLTGSLQDINQSFQQVQSTNSAFGNGGTVRPMLQVDSFNKNVYTIFGQYSLQSIRFSGGSNDIRGSYPLVASIQQYKNAGNSQEGNSQPDSIDLNCVTIKSMGGQPEQPQFIQTIGTRKTRSAMSTFDLLHHKKSQTFNVDFTYQNPNMTNGDIIQCSLTNTP